MEDIKKIKQCIEIEQARRVLSAPFKHYVPTGTGEEFIKTIGEDKYFVTGFIAANGVGKTYLGANILANLIWSDEKSEWFDYPLFNNWKYLKKIRIVSEPASVVGTIIPTLKAVFPEGRYTTSKRGKTYESLFKTDTGWEIDIMTYDQDIKEFESISVGFVWLDEPPTYRIYTACVSRLRMGGVMMMTLTPLTNAGWIYDKVICNTDGEKGQRTYIEADVWSASKTRGIRGFLDDRDIERMIAEYPEDEKEARIKGKFQHLTGLVYKQWDRRVHCIDPFTITDKDYVVINMLDPHPRTPDAVSWIAVDKYGQKFYIDELKFKGSSSELAQRIKRIDSQYRVVAHYADPAAFVEDQHHETSLAKKLEDFGLYYREAPKQRQLANRRLGDALSYQKQNNEFIVTPELYVFNTCNNFIYEIEHWIWDEYKGKTADNKDPKQTPIDKDDHFIENVGRALVINPEFESIRRDVEIEDTSLIADENHEYDPY